MAESQGEGFKLIGHYKALTDELEEKIKVLVATLKEKDSQMSVIKDQYDELLQNLQDKENKIIDLEFELLSSTQGASSVRRSLFTEKVDNETEKDEAFYLDQLEQKDEEIEKLNFEIDKLNIEVRKRTTDLQGIVNKELWEKNRYIEKMENRHTVMLENKDKEIIVLRNDVTNKDSQLKILRERISDLGINVNAAIEHPDGPQKDILLSPNFDNIRMLQEQLKNALDEKGFFESKINELQQKVDESSNDAKTLLIEKMKQEFADLQKDYEQSEKLRKETNELCAVLSARLEELAHFLDSLLKQKSLLGFLGSKENNKLRQVIDQSLDLSRSFNMSMFNQEQSMLQLNNLTSLLNNTGNMSLVKGFLNTSEVATQNLSSSIETGNQTIDSTTKSNVNSQTRSLINISDSGEQTSGSSKLDDEPVSLSIVPGNITLTYQSHLYVSSSKNNIAEDKTDNEGIICALRQQIENLKCELQIRDVELAKLQEQTYIYKLTESDNRQTDDDFRSKPIGDVMNPDVNENSPNKNTSATVRYRSDNQSESEAWSEPDRSVSKARIGLESNSRPSSAGKRSKLTCKISSESTEEENPRQMSRTPPKKNSIEGKQNIVELHRQICELEEKLLDKETRLIAVEEDNFYINNCLQEERSKFARVKTELENKDAEQTLALAESKKTEAETKVKKLEKCVSELQAQKKALESQFDTSTKEVMNQINSLQIERDEVQRMANEAKKQANDATNELNFVEQKLKDMHEEMRTLEDNIKKEYEEHTAEKLKNAEGEFIRQLKITEQKAETEIKFVEEKARAEIMILQEHLKKIEREYERDYVKKCEVDQRLAELETLTVEIDLLRASLNEQENTIDILKNKELDYKEKIQEYQEKINLIRRELDNATLQYSEAVLEKTRISNEKTMLENELSKVNSKEAEMKKQILEVQMEFGNVRQKYQNQITQLQGQKSKLEVRISELESANAELHNRLISLRTTAAGEHYYSTSLPNPSISFHGRSVPGSASFRRQCSDNSEYISEDHHAIEGGYSYAQPLRLDHNAPGDLERHEANSSPDLGIESDHGRFSSLEANLNIPRPLLQTLELTESMSNLLDGDNQVQNVKCDNEHCYKKSLEMAHENNDLKKKLLKTRRALEDTVTQLTLANQRKKQVEKNICKQIHKTSQVLRKAKANLDSGSETDIYKK